MSTDSVADKIKDLQKQIDELTKTPEILRARETYSDGSWKNTCATTRTNHIGCVNSTGEIDELGRTICRLSGSKVLSWHSCDHWMPKNG